jgi:hypothetical protein
MVKSPWEKQVNIEEGKKGLKEMPVGIVLDSKCRISKELFSASRCEPGGQINGTRRSLCW